MCTPQAHVPGAAGSACRGPGRKRKGKQNSTKPQQTPAKAEGQAQMSHRSIAAGRRLQKTPPSAAQEKWQCTSKAQHQEL